MRRLSWLPALILALVVALPSQAQAVRPEVVARGLQNPWGMAFIGNGQVLVTERPGRLRLVSARGEVGPAIDGLPPIEANGQGGLLDVIADSAFASNRRVYFCFSEPGAGGNSTALASARLSDDSRRLEQLRVIFSQRPKVASRLHFGCRIVEAPDGTLFLTLGDRFSRMADAQTLDNHHGKVIRVHKDGSVPRDNPLLGRAGALPEIWSWGHRNPQGATWGPDQRLWVGEHGPQGGDEINRPEPGRNYGWPVITYGENYGGGPIGEGLTARPGLEQPLHHWTPSIAPAGMDFLTSDRYGSAWRGSLFVSSLKLHYVTRLQWATEGGEPRLVREERVLDVGQRVRDIRQGPDGLLYLLTDDRDGRLIRLLPG